MGDKYLDILLDIQKSVGSLLAKHDAQEKDLDEHKKEDSIAHMRITSLEKTRSEARGGYAVLVVAVAIVSSLATALATAWVRK